MHPQPFTRPQYQRHWDFPLGESKAAISPFYLWYPPPQPRSTIFFLLSLPFLSLSFGTSCTRQTAEVLIMSNSPMKSQNERPRDPHERPTYNEPPAMATAFISPSAPYGAQTSPSGFAPSGSGRASIAGMVSPIESRRTADENESGLKAISLPPISEFIRMAGSQPLPLHLAISHRGSPNPLSSPLHPHAYPHVGPDRHSSPRSMGPPFPPLLPAPPGPFPRCTTFHPLLDTYAGGYHTYLSPSINEFEHHNSEPPRLNGSSPYGSHPVSAHQQQQQQPPMPFSVPPTGHPYHIQLELVDYYCDSIKPAYSVGEVEKRLGVSTVPACLARAYHRDVILSL